MAQRGTDTRPPALGRQQDNVGFPGLVPDSSKINHDELQQNELLALEAIYGEDFVKTVAAPSPWKKAEPSFDIHIRASTDEDFAVTLGFVMTATYPKTPPLLTVKDLDNLHESTQGKIKTFIETQPKAYAKDELEMIDKIVEGVRDILEDAAQAKATGSQLPSLDEERDRHEASVAQQAQLQRAEEARKKLAETEAEERNMSEMLEEQLKLQRQMAKESKMSRRPNDHFPAQSIASGLDSNQVDFDHVCNVSDKDGNFITFRSVASKCEVRRGPVSVVYTVRPVLLQGQSSQTMALKEAVLRSTDKKTPQDVKNQLQALESLLQDLKASKKLVHRHLVELMDFKVESGLPDDPTAADSWTVRILTSLADRGSLEELLDLAGTIDIDKVRSWTRDLLDALSFLHSKNLTHADIHAGNVLLFREVTGEVIPKLSDASYQRELHCASIRKQSSPGLSSARSAYWLPPEIAGASKPQFTHKSDVWDFGVVFARMVFGPDVMQKHTSPKALMASATLSRPFQELISRFFKDDKQKRPRVFELGSSEFLATDAPIYLDGSSIVDLATSHMSSQQSLPARLRRESMNRSAISSRYAEDFVEEGRLGKGGFGEVVKARKKLDGHIYAIKKITQRSRGSLTEILKEVRVLSRLSHPAIVQYYYTWVEEVPDLPGLEGDTSTDGSSDGATARTGSNGHHTPFLASTTGGLDFMSSSAAVEFADDDDDDEDDESDESDDDDDSEESGESDGDESEHSSDQEGSIIGSDMMSRPASIPVKRRTSTPRRPRPQRLFKTILYISMEYCEKRTLRDLISRNLYKNTPEIWRLFRQILEGLEHIHALGIVHRDLKPENIFISSGVDDVDHVKIGDFGLATSGQFSIDRMAAGASMTDSMTRSIGTTSYAAPEVKSTATGLYNTKVDMYSLGIIFFEMCYEPMLGMQKADVLGKLRLPKPELPADFKPASKTQTDIVLALVTHDPNERPSSAELLRGGKLPVPMEREMTRRVLTGLSDPTSSYYPEMLNTLFARSVPATKDFAWDMVESKTSAAELLSLGTVKETLTSIFRRHGALESARTSIYPKSQYYGDDVVKVLDSNGTVLQLPYDLTLGHARIVAKQAPSIQKSFAFGTVFRDKKDMGQPQAFGEVDFDIVATDTLDLALKEAEVLKVLDEIILAFPHMSPGQMCFHLGHSDLLQLIFEHCRIEPACRRAAADALSKLNVHNHTWHNTRLELRSPAIGLSATSVEELQRFDFRDTPSKTSTKLKALFKGSDRFQRASSTLAHLKEVAEYAKLFNVATKVYISPLNSLKESFYSGGILFSCLHDGKRVKDVFAAGGRYDHLISQHRPRIGGQMDPRHGVGFGLAWERLAKSHKTAGNRMSARKATEELDTWLSERRCDCLVASLDGTALRSTGIEILHKLWSNDISAELAKEARSPKDLLAKHKDDDYAWIIMIKQNATLKIKTMGRSDIADVDIDLAKLISWIRTQIRERDSRAVMKRRGGGGGGGSSGSSSSSSHSAEALTGSSGERDRDQNVTLLVAQARSKKFDRRTVVEQAQAGAADLSRSFLDGPVLAVETTDQVMDLIRGTSLSDHESWRRVEQAVTTQEKKYVKEMHDQLDKWRQAYESQNGSRHSFIYNFRTGTCLYYDLGRRGNGVLVNRTL